MSGRAAADKRRRRERGSLNPEDIIDGAFELAQTVSIDGLSMPLLGRHLDVGVTSIYWYFRRKDDLLNAMTDRALRQYVYAVPYPYVEAANWRETLATHARTLRRTFLDNPILCDLILIRSALSQHAGRIGADQVERTVSSLVNAGLSVDQALDTYSALNLHIRGSVVLQRLYDRNQDSPARAYYDSILINPDTTPLLARAMAKGMRSGAPDDRNFEYGLHCILDHTAHLIADNAVGISRSPGSLHANDEGAEG
ncbi:TetR/AcrR family transcriptional regulator C-terminal domain-containing protein [Nocardia macrotermitis]|uniref:PE-PGRS family protein n=1 Tax=Nocardia macrotermitis TaxID=2585198 RepID=A0A7K0DF12_9NOCA|nr:TetR/AcrR family transcriptional regulator C-terminal domain-containing protein [Nocardia macrotermitis]MQY24121.1 PE-PGRS family protein [Nocardia macrotermitis]